MYSSASVDMPIIAYSTPGRVANTGVCIVFTMKAQFHLFEFLSDFDFCLLCWKACIFCFFLTAFSACIRVQKTKRTVKTSKLKVNQL